MRNNPNIVDAARNEAQAIEGKNFLDINKNIE